MFRLNPLSSLDPSYHRDSCFYVTDRLPRRHSLPTTPWECLQPTGPSVILGPFLELYALLISCAFVMYRTREGYEPQGIS